MLKSFIFGIILSIGILLAHVWINFYLVSAYFVVSVIFIAIAILISGFSVSGDRMRANNASESRNDRKWRIGFSGKLVLIAIPNIIALCISYYMR